MFRIGFALLATGIAIVTSIGLVSAEPVASETGTTAPKPVREYRRVAVPTPASGFTHRKNGKLTTEMSEISPWLYLNRCTGGCAVVGTGNSTNVNDAMANESSIPSSGNYTIGEFANGFGQLGSNGTCLVCPDSTHHDCSMGTPSTMCTSDTTCTTAFPNMNAYCDSADADWADFLQCMKEVDSPYALNVTDTIPPGGAAYTEGMIGGLSSNIGLPADILGIAPILCDAPQDNAISFSFANQHPGYGVGGGNDRVYNICWTAAQETSHVWGLDHEYQYTTSVLSGNGGDSACNDPMTYRADCGGEKFYRDELAFVGTFGKGVNQVCRPTQNSHQMVLAVFGPGTSLIPNPTVDVTFPTTGSVVTANFPVDADAGSRRGVWLVELWLNGYKWQSQPGVAFGLPDGQTNPSSYTLQAPNGVPMGAIDVVVKAYDDLGGETDSAPLTVMFGAACTADSACAKGQHCNTGSTDNGMAPPGGCYWDTPTGQLGAKCAYPQFCMSGMCDGTATEQICTQSCTIGIDAPCPNNLDCIPTGGSNSTTGICFPAGGSGGCCSASGADLAWAQGGLSALVLGAMFRRRRKR